MWRNLAAVDDRFRDYLGCGAKLQKYPNSTEASNCIRLYGLNIYVRHDPHGLLCPYFDFQVTSYVNIYLLLEQSPSSWARLSLIVLSFGNGNSALRDNR